MAKAFGLDEVDVSSDFGHQTVSVLMVLTCENCGKEFPVSLDADALKAMKRSLCYTCGSYTPD